MTFSLPSTQFHLTWYSAFFWRLTNTTESSMVRSLSHLFLTVTVTTVTPLVWSHFWSPETTSHEKSGFGLLLVAAAGETVDRATIAPTATAPARPNMLRTDGWKRFKGCSRVLVDARSQRSPTGGAG